VAPKGERGTGGVLGYSYGELRHWKAKLSRNESSNVCDARVMHGAYSQQLYYTI
jgi:hypothetical protein